MSDTATTDNGAALPAAEVAVARPIARSALPVTGSAQAEHRPAKPGLDHGASRYRTLDRLLWATPSWLLSMVIHIVGLLLLAMLYLPSGTAEDILDLVASTEAGEEFEDLTPLDGQSSEEIDFTVTEVLSFEPETEPEDVEFYAFDESAAAISVKA